LLIFRIFAHAQRAATKKEPLAREALAKDSLVGADQLLICVLLKANRLAHTNSRICATSTTAPAKEEQT
jgi:hypothetical protein